jgi:hypothetical protein
LPAPVRDRRPALAAIAVLLILSGAFASGLLVYRSGERTDVLVARDDIDVGTTITANDFGDPRPTSSRTPPRGRLRWCGWPPTPHRPSTSGR